MPALLGFSVVLARRRVTPAHHAAVERVVDGDDSAGVRQRAGLFGEQ